MSDKFIYDNYFETIAPIWTDFFKEKIGLAERDRRLEGYRQALYREQLRRKKIEHSHFLNPPIPKTAKEVEL